MTAILHGSGPREHSKKKRRSLARQVWSARWCYLFMVPALLLAGMFTFYPMVATGYYSTLDWSGIDSAARFIGIDNYAEAIRDPFFWAAFRRTFIFAIAVVTVSLALSLALAIVLNDQALRMRALFRTIFFLPVVTTTAIVGLVMGLLLDPFDGPINSVLLDLGVIDRPIDFLGDPKIALWSVAAVWVWKWMGLSMIYWLVSLQTVPQELYEAAWVDGASRWQAHRQITLPLIAPFALIISLIAFVGALQVFPLVQAMTRGGPFFSTELVELYIYRLAFTTTQGLPRLGFASAVAVLFGLTVLALTLAQAWGVRRAVALGRELRRSGR